MGQTRQRLRGQKTLIFIFYFYFCVFSLHDSIYFDANNGSYLKKKKKKKKKNKKKKIKNLLKT